MKNIINNNCSNNTNNEINNNKSEVKTMRKITNNTINFNANALNSSIIASAIGYEGNGYDGFLFGDDIGCYIDDSGEVLPIKALTADDYDQIGEYAKQINSLQPERIRLSDDQIDAYIANAKLEG